MPSVTPRALVRPPSFGATTYQAIVLAEELLQTSDGEYPPPACQLRDVYLCFAEHLLQELWELYDPDNPMIPRNDPKFTRTVALSRGVHDLYSHLRYLRYTTPSHTPPAIQQALAHLLTRYFPKGDDTEPVCIVGPQYEYNLEYVPLTRQLQRLVAPSVLDPHGALGITSPRDIIPRLWQARQQRNPDLALSPQPPAHLAVLSFACLDTHDALLYPLLAHELGHFIDFSTEPPLHLDNEITAAAAISFADVEGVLPPHSRNAVDVNEQWRLLSQRTTVCLREILADLLATRMLGFSFFVALAEFLKTLTQWPQATILSLGYPGVQLRLSIVHNHIAEKMKKSLDVNNKPENSEIVEALRNYLETWRSELANPTELLKTPRDPKASVENKLTHLVEAAILRALPRIEEMARRTIPDDNGVVLTKEFFHHIECLRMDFPPISHSATPLAEVLSAAWAYQITYGEEREIEKRKLDEQFGEYVKTCRLVLKGIELSMMPPPPTGAHDDALHTGSGSTLNVPSGVLGPSDLIQRIALPPRAPKALGVVPFDPRSVQAASLDVRLGHWFAVFRRTHVPGMKLSNGDLESGVLDERFVPFGGRFIIHPGDLVLGTTLEFVSLPLDVMALVEGRSRVGRTGLIVVTASQVAPGFHGVIVLELANAGTVPLHVEPGKPIAQLVFQSMTRPVPASHGYRGRFHCQIKPVPEATRATRCLSSVPAKSRIVTSKR